MILVLALLAPPACQPADIGEEEEASAETEADAVTVEAKDFEFAAPEAISSGWTTFRFANASDEQEHFFLLYRLPDNKTFADYRSEAFEPYHDVWNRYDAGKLTRQEANEALAEALPAWPLEEATASGGAALAEAGRTSQVTLDLEPGTYVMECYVRTPQGTFHNDRGMLRELTVTEESTGASAPEAGATGFMTVELDPGRYAWVSEYFGDRGMVEEHTVE